MRDFNSYSKIGSIHSQISRLECEITCLSCEMGNYYRTEEISKNELRLLSSLKSFAGYAYPKSFIAFMSERDKQQYLLTLSKAIRKVAHLKSKMDDMLDDEYYWAIFRMETMVDSFYATLAALKSEAIRLEFSS